MIYKTSSSPNFVDIFYIYPQGSLSNSSRVRAGLPHTDREPPQSDAKIGSSKFNKRPRPCRRSSRSRPTARRRESEMSNFPPLLMYLRAAGRRESAVKTLVVIEISSSEDDDHGATSARCVYSHTNGPQARPQSRYQPPRHRATRKVIESSSESDERATYECHRTTNMSLWLKMR